MKRRGHKHLAAERAAAPRAHKNKAITVRVWSRLLLLNTKGKMQWGDSVFIKSDLWTGRPRWLGPGDGVSPSFVQPCGDETELSHRSELNKASHKCFYNEPVCFGGCIFPFLFTRTQVVQALTSSREEIWIFVVKCLKVPQQKRILNWINKAPFKPEWRK